MKRAIYLCLVLVGLAAMSMPTALAQKKPENPCNPCKGKAANPCNPCKGKAANPCNPCKGKAANPCNPCKGKAAKMPAMNPCHGKHGTVFYVADTMKRNTVTFTSEAPLEDIIGTTMEVSGYVVFNPEKPRKGVRASFSVPTASLKTGIPLRDEHLSGGMWLNAKEYPEITLTINDVKRVKKVKKTDAYQTYDMVLIGEFGLHGMTKTIDITARITYMRESDNTRTKMPGDLLAGRASFEVPLASFGITGPPGMDLIGTKVGDTVGIEVRFTSSTAKPAAANPCNPCNPCKGKKSS